MDTELFVQTKKMLNSHLLPTYQSCRVTCLVKSCQVCVCIYIYIYIYNEIKYHSSVYTDQRERQKWGRNGVWNNLIPLQYTKVFLFFFLLYLMFVRKEKYQFKWIQNGKLGQNRS